MFKQPEPFLVAWADLLVLTNFWFFNVQWGFDALSFKRRI